MQRVNWVVYAKRPFGGPAQVLAYLGRYTHRVAISNSRIKAFDDEAVAFTWKDYRQNGAVKVMHLKPDEFIRRFLLHTLPDGFHRLRSFGFMANAHRAAKLALCRLLLSPGVEPTTVGKEKSSTPEQDRALGAQPPPCSLCGGVMRVVASVPGLSRRHGAHASPFHCDTS